MLDPLPFLEFHSLGMDCFGHPLFVYGKGGGPARNGVQEEGLQILHVYSGTLGLYLRFVTPYVIRKPLGGRSVKIKPTFQKTCPVRFITVTFRHICLSYVFINHFSLKIRYEIYE